MAKQSTILNHGINNEGAGTYILRTSFVVVCALTLSSCSYKIASYLKSKSSEPIVYRFSFVKSDDPVYRQLDMMLGQASEGDTVRGEMVIVYKTVEIEGRKAYFAIEAEDTIRKDPSIGSTQFLNAAMVFSGDSILLASIHKKSDLKKLRYVDFNQFIPSKVRLTDTLVFFDRTIWNNEKQLLLYGFKKEKIIVSKQKLNNCLSFTIMERRPQSSSTGKVWLHKNYGVVRWVRVTGRVDERKF